MAYWRALSYSVTQHVMFRGVAPPVRGEGVDRWAEDFPRPNPVLHDNNDNKRTITMYNHDK